MLRLILFAVRALLALSILIPSGAAIGETLMPRVTDFHALLAPGPHRVTIRVDGLDRKFIFVTPTGFHAGETLPIVFFFHGAGGTAEQGYRTYGWAQKADAAHFFAVFPEGMPAFPDKAGSFFLNPHIWRDERTGGRHDGGVNDIHFFEDLLGRLQAALPIDARRIYVTGFSNGAAMTFTLGSRFSDRIAAIAPVSSQSFVESERLARPLPLYYLTGKADPIIPYLGGTVTLLWGTVHTAPPIQETVDTWAKLDGCPPQPQTLSDQDGVRVQHYGPGANGAEIIFTTIEGNGHHWPQTVEPLPEVISGPCRDPFNATDRIWEFFAKHPLPAK